MKVKCPCCDGTGKIEERAPVSLSPLQFKVYDIIRKAVHGITGPWLIESTQIAPMVGLTLLRCRYM